MMPNKLISYAQNKEDVILYALLKDKKKGFYIDVGANHAVHDSVTKLFYDQGWHGINIEPAAKLHAQLSADRSRDLNLNVGISNQKGELTFREYLLGDGLSTFSHETWRQYEEDKDYRYYASKYIDRVVPVTTLKDIFEKYALEQTVDFIKIDIEGYEYEAIEGNDWNKYRPTIVCVEANHMVKDWRPILLKANYQLALNDGLNDYFIAKEHVKLLDNYSYASIMFFNPIPTWKEERQRLAHVRENRQLQYTLNQLQNENKSLKTTQAQRTLPSTFKSWLRFSAFNTLRSFDYYINLVQPPKKLNISHKKLAQINKEELTAMVRKQASKKRSGLRYTVHITLAWVYRTIKKHIKRGVA